jgi:hypothetical protein
MDQTVDQIEDHIESSREDLRSNLEELGQKVKSAVDWREKFRANPGAILAVAFGGGFILAKVVGGARGHRTGPSASRQAATLAATQDDDRKGQMPQVWDDIQSALLGVVATKITNTLAEVVPGFTEQLGVRDEDARVVNPAPGTH